MWALPLLVSLALSATTVGRATLSRDELATWEFAQLSVPDLFRAVSHVDAVLAPYYLLMHLWTSVGGDGTVWLRVPSVLAIAAAAAIAARLGRDAWGSWAGLGTGLAFALSPVVASTAVEARPYAGAMLLATLETALVLAPAPLPRGRYVAAMVGAVVLHLFALTVVVAHLLATRRRDLVLPAAAVAALAVPVAVVGQTQKAQVVYIPMPDLARTATLTRLAAAPNAYGWLVLAAIVVLLVAAVLTTLRGKDLTPYWTAIALVVVPSLLLLLASHLLSPVLQRRYLITAPLGAAILVGGAIALVRGRRLLQVAALVAVVCVAAPGVREPHVLRPVDADFHGLAAHLAAHARPGDGLQVTIRKSQGGMPAGVALYTGDRAFLAEILDDLPGGAPLTYRRVFTDGPDTVATEQLRPVEWLVAVYRTGPALAASRALRAEGCTRTDLRKEGDLALYRFRCPDAATVRP